jgi:hypothetical protein
MGEAGMSVIWVNSGRFSAAPTLWTFANTATEAWLLPNNAGSITTTSGSLSQIRDAKGNGRIFDGAAGSRPTILANALNGKASMAFNGSQWLTFTGAASIWNFLHNASGSTIVAVWKAGIISNPNAIMALLGTNAVASANIGTYIAYDDRASVPRNDRVLTQVSGGGNQSVGNVSADGAHPGGTPVIITHISDPGNPVAANRSILRINGVSIQNNTSTTAPSSANASYALQVGAGGGNAFPHLGEIYEIGIMSGASLATAERAEGYLAGPVAGWDLQSVLSAGHPYKSAAPTV